MASLHYSVKGEKDVLPESLPSVTLETIIRKTSQYFFFLTQASGRMRNRMGEFDGQDRESQGMIGQVIHIWGHGGEQSVFQEVRAKIQGQY